MMRPYYIVSEEYQTYGGCYEPPEPPEYGCDCIEILAENRRDAKILGVQLALQQRHSLAKDNRSDGTNVYAGYHVEDAVCQHGTAHFDFEGGQMVHPKCQACEVEV